MYAIELLFYSGVLKIVHVMPEGGFLTVHVDLIILCYGYPTQMRKVLYLGFLSEIEFKRTLELCSSTSSICIGAVVEDLGA